jgi:hypothetical protein
MDNVQTCDIYINIPLSQTYRCEMGDLEHIQEIKNEYIFCRTLKGRDLLEKPER